MRFDLVDAVLEQSAERIVTIKQVTVGEEYLQDHFPTFPVLPGVMMLEAMVQAGRRLIEGIAPGAGPPLVLGRVRALKYGRFVKPGSALRVEVTLIGPLDGGAWDFKGEATVLTHGAAPASGAGSDRSSGQAAASGRFTLRPLRLASIPGGAGAASA